MPSIPCFSSPISLVPPNARFQFPAISRISIPIACPPSYRVIKSCEASPRSSTTAPLPPLLPRKSIGTTRISYAEVVQQCGASIRASVPENRLLCLDFPPEYSETRAGTLVSRYENNLNFMEKLLLALGCAEGDWVPVGGMATVEIRDNINPQGGGDYLTDDEVMCGYRANFCHALNAGIVILMNAGVDASTLKHVQNLDDGKAVMVLLNCGVDRISWFAKRSFASYINQYVAAYYLKAVAGCGWFFKQSPWPWATYVETSSGLKLLSNAERRPKFVDVQADVNIAVALMRQENK